MPIEQINFRSAWEAMEKENPRPTRVRYIKYWEWDGFKDAVLNADFNFIWLMVMSLYAGDVYILKGTFPKEWIQEVKRKAFEYGQSSPSSFHKMLEGTPDFHRIIDLEAGQKYSLNVCKHSCFFYPWNDDPLGLFGPVYERWRTIKVLMGLDSRAYESNTPKAGVVDRIQIAQYPSRIGFLEPHSDPYVHQRLFFSGYMTKRGVDYQGGGFYLVGVQGHDCADSGDYVVEAEDGIDVGDVGIGYATIYHGVAPCNRDKEPDWNSMEGRWFLSMYSNASDEVKDRHTGHPVKLQLEGVTP